MAAIVTLLLRSSVENGDNQVKNRATTTFTSQDIYRLKLARLRLIGLFLVGLAIVAVTITRLIMNVTNYQRSGASHNIANIELFFSAFVANAPPIYGLINAKISSST
ncbi:uncharacterized protein N7498_002242 [Penicillium cinerascens]|uniref:Uncharacterized protein n=1 Tax=Penicillium cinerascens TaxID=70096 RepID=A0A9W9N9P2_9EURO|nr:uncharacterized protein N7498_002242 [Penicillium cinerascens]KAJ5215835.1 hypothetical protein N7498_002242 [Penicillium cinerascens]